MAGQTIKTGWSAIRPPTFAKAGNGSLFIVNGIDKPQMYDGVSAGTYDWGIVAPAKNPTVTATTGGAATAGDYIIAYRYTTGDETPRTSSVSPNRTFSASGNDAFTYSDLLPSDNPRIKFVEIFRGTSGQVLSYYFLTRLGHGAGDNHADNISTATDNGSGEWRITCTEPHHLVNGSIVTVSGITGGTGHNGADQEVDVISDTVFDLPGTTYDSNGAGGKWVLTGWGTAAGGTDFNDTYADTALNLPVSGVLVSSVTGVTYTGKTRFTTAAAHGMIVGSRVAIANHSVDKYNQREHTIIAVPTTTTFETDADYDGSDGSDGTWALVNTALPVLKDDGTSFARRQEPPVNYMASAVQFQDRMWLAVNRFYSEGTISGTIATKTVTGSATAWTSQMAGRYLYPAGANKAYKIVKAAATTLTLDEPLAAAISASTAYTIRPDPSVENELYYSEVDEPESFPSTNVVRIQLRTDDDDRWTALAPYGTIMVVFRERTCYSLAYAKQPKIDAFPNLMAYRGCFNQQCWKLAEGVLYAMDAMGPYRLTGGAPERIGDAVLNYFRDGLIDLSKSHWFSVHADPVEGVVRFNVSLVADSDVRPGTSLCYSYRTDSWWTETYWFEIGGMTSVNMAGETRRLVAGENDAIYLANEGYLDGTSGTGSAVRGSVASATSSTLVTATAPPADADESVVAIVSGTGKSQTRVITSTSGSGPYTINVSPNWTTTPDSTSVYQIGGISWAVRTGLMKWSVEGWNERQKGQPALRRELGLTFQPTSTDCRLDVLTYADHNTTPDSVAPSSSSGSKGVSADPADSTALVVDLASSLSAYPGVVSPGHEHVSLGLQGSEHELESNRFVAIRLQGIGGEAEVKLYEMSLDGVAE